VEANNKDFAVAKLVKEGADTPKNQRQFQRFLLIGFPEKI
jgi:hypothetical protein